MVTRRPRREGGRTQLDIDADKLVWALYGRESFDPTKSGEQVENQLSDLRPFVLGIGGKIGREFPENNFSAYRRQQVQLPDGTWGYRVVRPDWDAMMTGLRQGRWNAVALPNIDRGMRDPRDLEDLIDLVEQYGVYVVGMTGDIDLSSDDGISNARREVDQRNRESRNISRRTTRGNRKAALKGKRHTAVRPFGWRQDYATLNKREVKHILREIPRLLAGVTVYTIAREWQDRAIPTVKGSRWRSTTLHQMFTNPRLCGWRTYHGEVLRDDTGEPVVGQWEPVITPETHLELVAKLGAAYPFYRKPKTDEDGTGTDSSNGAAERPSMRGRRTKYLLSPFLRCAKCNAKLTGSRRRWTADSEWRVYYRCPGRNNGGCGGVTVPGPEVERYVIELVMADQSRINMGRPETAPPWPGKRDLDAVRQQINETTDGYKKRMISAGRYFPLLEGLETEERRLIAQQRKYEAGKSERYAALDVRDEWDRMTLEQKHAAIGRSIVAVIVKPASAKGVRFSVDRLEVVPREHDPE